MKNIRLFLGLLLSLVVLFGTGATTVYASSSIPDYFDFGTWSMTIPAGGEQKMWLAAYYDYTYYIEGATSDATFLECSFKKDTGYVTFHIGADEQGKNIYFHFYVDDEKVENKDLHDSVVVYVKDQQAVASSIDAGISGGKTGKLTMEGNRSMLYNNKGVAMASFSLKRGNGLAADYVLKGIESSNGKNYFAITTGYGESNPIISESDKAVMIANGYTGVCVNGRYVNWP